MRRVVAVLALLFGLLVLGAAAVGFVYVWSASHEPPVEPPPPREVGPDADVAVRRHVASAAEGTEPTAARFADEGASLADDAVRAEPVLWSTDVSIHVRVIADDDRVPVEGAVVRMTRAGEARQATTDETGIATLPYPLGAPEWSVRSPGYLVAFPELSRRVDDERVVRLARAPARHGIVLDATTRSPVAGARVSAWNARFDWKPADVVQETGADGRFTLAGVRATDPAEVVVVARGCAAVTARTPADPTAPMEIVVGAGATVRGTVRDTGGSAATGATVRVLADGDEGPGGASVIHRHRADASDAAQITDAAGGYHMRGVAAPSRVVVHARGADGALGRSPPLAIDNASVDVIADIVVAATGRVQVVFIDATSGDELPLDCARVTIDAERTEAREDQHAIYDDDAGTAFLDGVAAGRHLVFVDPDDHLTPAPVEVHVAAGEDARVQIALTAGRIVTGRTVDTSGRPVVVYVSFSAEWEGVEQYPNALSKKDGRFALRNVPPVAGTLAAFHNQVGRSEWFGVSPQGDLGDLVIAFGPALVARLPPTARGERVTVGVRSASTGHVSEATHVDDSIRITGVKTGETTRVFVQVPGHAAWVVHDIVLAEGEQRDIGDVVFPDPVTLRGRVLDHTGAPVGGAAIRTVEWWSEDLPSTDAEGRFALTLLPPGALTLWIEPSQDAVHFQPVVVAPGMDEFVVRLPQPGRLVLRILGAADQPRPATHVNIYRLLDSGAVDWQRRVIAQTDSRGMLEIPLYPGPYGAAPHPSHGLELVGEPPTFDVAPGATVDVTLRVR